MYFTGIETFSQLVHQDDNGAVREFVFVKFLYEPAGAAELTDSEKLISYEHLQILWRQVLPWFCCPCEPGYLIKYCVV